MTALLRTSLGISAFYITLSPMSIRGGAACAMYTRQNLTYDAIRERIEPRSRKET